MPFSAGINAASDMGYDVFPFAYLIKNNYNVEINEDALKISPPAKGTF